ncbi:phage tail tape measure protein [Paenibacillus ehimensis]|uniref:phage tail tape measure protein n=1 Tax=Paenibacillus ehimensis TaxID=79264 RepID=UPI002DBEC0AC|nr:phage tail tape measure protein [Paenibacillus ehimensis]MEC0210242.1 phage tail tape measure protein [Paenibacillus ehimensis]
MSDLRILVSATLNEKRSIVDLNEAIKKIQNDPALQKLKLNIDIDQKFARLINEFTDALNKMKQVSQDQNKVISENTEIFKRLDGTVQQVTQKVLKNGEIIQRTKTIHDESKKAILDESQAALKLSESIDKLNKSELDSITINKNRSNKPTGYAIKSSEGYSVTTKRIEPDGETLKSLSTTTNYKKQREDELNLINQMADFREKSELRVREEQRKTAEAQQKSIQKNMDMDREEAERKLRNLENFRANYIAKITDLQRRYGSKINVDALNGLRAELKNLDIGNADFDKKLVEIPNKIKQIGAEAKIASAHSLNFGEALSTAFQKFPVWLISGTVFMQSIHFFTEGIKYVNELNANLTQIGTAVNYNQEKLASLGKQFQQLGQEISATTKDVSAAALEFYRQGLGDEQVLNRLKLTTQYAKISGLEFTQSAELLTAASNSMHQDITKVADVFTYLGDATATSASEIGVAFQKVGGTAESLKVPFEKVASYIATISAQTREAPETIGSAVKSIFSRIGSVKERGYDAEDGTDVNQIAKSLAAANIQLIDSNKQFRNFATVLDELGAKWNTLDDRTKRYIATTVAGAYQQSRFLTLMDSYDKSVQLYQQALESAGTTQQKYNIYLEGTQAHIDKLKGVMQGLWSNAFKSDTINATLNILTKLLSAIDFVIKNFGLIPTVVGLGTAALFIFKGTALTTFLGLTQKIVTSVTSFSTLTASINTATIATRGLSLAMSLTPLVASTAIIAGLTWAITEFFSAEKTATTESDKLSETYRENVKSISEKKDALKKLADEYQSLKSKTDKTTEDIGRLNKIEKELVQTYGVSITGINSQGEAYSNSIEAINRRIEALSKQKEIEDEILRNKVIGKNQSERESIDEQIKKVEDYTKKVTELQTTLDNMQNAIANGGSVKLLNGQTTDDKEYLKRLVQGYNADLGYFREALKTANDELIKSSQDIVTVVTNEFNSQLSKSGKTISDKGRLFTTEIIKSLSISNVPIQEQFNIVREMAKDNSFDELIVKYEKLKDEFSKSPTEEMDAKLKQASDNVKRTIEDTIKTTPKLTEAAKSGLKEFADQFVVLFNNAKDTSAPIGNLANTTSRLASEVEKAEKELKPLNLALSDVRKGQTLSSDAIADLIIKYPELASAIKQTTNGYTLEEAALEKLRKAKVDKYISDLEAEKNMTQVTLSNSLARMKAYGIELSNIRTVEQAKAKIGQIEMKKYYGEQNNDLGSKLGLPNFFAKRQEKEADDTLAALNDFIKELTERETQIEALKKLINDPNFGVGDRKEKKEKKEAQLKDALDYIELEKEIVNSLNETYEARKKVIDLEKKQIDIIEKQKDYNSAIQKTNDLIDNQLKALEDLNTANTGITGKADEARMNAINNKDILSDIKRSNPDFALPDNVEEAKKYVREYFDTWFNSSGDASEAYKKFINSFAERSKVIHDNTSLSVDDRNKELDKIEKQKKSIEKLFGVVQVYKQGWTENVNRINEMNTAIESSHESLNKLRKEAHDIRIAGLDDQLKEIQRTLETLPESSSQYRNELEKLIQLNKEKQNVEHQSAEESRARIASGKLSTEQIVYENEMIKSLSNSWWDYQKIIQDNAFKIITSTINASAESVKKYDDQLQISKDRLGLLKEGTKAYSDELQKQIKLLQDKLSAEEAHESVIRKQMDTVGLTQEQWNNLNQQLKQSVLAQISIASSIKSANQSLKEQLDTIANDVIEIYKEMYEKQKEVALKAIDDELKALEKSHKRKVDLLDEEMKKYEDLVQAKLKAIDEQANEEDYQKQLIKLTKERDEIQKQIDTRKMDTSLEGKAKTAELLKQLQEKNDEIDDFQKKNLRETAKKTLQDQLEEKKKSVDSQKEIEDKSYENEKERLDKIKEATEKHYNDLIQDETRFEKIREDIRKGNISKAMSDLGGFRDFVLKNSEIIGNGLSNTLIDKIGKVSTKLQEITPIVSSQFQQMANDLQDKMITKMDELILKFRELDNLKFGNLATQLGNVSDIIAQMQKNSQQWYSATPDDQKRLEQENNKLGSSIGAGKNDSGDWVKDGKQLYETFYIPQNDQEKEQIRMMKINSDAWKTALNDRDKKILEEDNQKRGSSIGAIYKNGTWFKNNIPLYHDGGIVGGKGTPLMEKLHKLLNLGSDEQLSILKQGELVIKNNPIDIIGNLISKIKLPDFSNLSLSPNLAAAGNTYHTYHFNIDKVIGDKKGAHDFVSEVFKDMKNRGKA